MPPPCLLVRAIAVTIHQRQVLLVASKASPGAWVPPGGKLERREPAHEAARREVREETGVAVDIGPLIAYREVWWPQRDIIELYFAARPTQPLDALTDASPEGRTSRWVPVAELRRLKHFPEDLARLCVAAQDATAAADPAAAPLYLGVADLRDGSR